MHARALNRPSARFVATTAAGVMTFAGTAGAASALCGPVAAHAAAAQPAADGSNKPAMLDYTKVLAGYEALWKPQGDNTMRGDVENEKALDANDQVISWINQHATSQQKFRALQNSVYSGSTDTSYDQSMTIADGLGKTLGALYVKGRLAGELPLTSALITSRDGSVGHAVETNKFKGHFSYPRPFMRASSKGTVCASQGTDASSLAGIRQGEAWADAKGDLTITQVPPAVDRTHEFAPKDVALNASYAGLCRSGSFPSGHTAAAYEAGSVLATMLPEVAPGILARASEAGNNRIVLGVHYPLDVIGGRIVGQSALATLWNDDRFRTSTLEPARTELRDYLTKACTQQLHVSTLADCVAKDEPYTDDPYGGAAMPGGTAQKVTDRASALAVYTERMSYGIGVKAPAAQGDSTTVADGGAGMKADDVPAAAASLLRTTYPTLSDEQRRDVIAQTALASGSPLAVGDGAGWQRMNLAAAMSADVRVEGDAVKVAGTGGQATVDGRPASSASASGSWSQSASGDAGSAQSGSVASGASAPKSDASSSGLSTTAWVAIGAAALAAVAAVGAALASARRRGARSTR